MCWHIHNRFQLLLSQGPDLSRLRERLRMEKRLLQTTIMLKLRRRLGKMKRMRGRWKMAVRIIWMSNRPAWTRANELLKVYPYIFPGRTKRAIMHHKVETRGMKKYLWQTVILRRLLIFLKKTDIPHLWIWRFCSYMQRNLFSLSQLIAFIETPKVNQTWTKTLSRTEARSIPSNFAKCLKWSLIM